MKLYDTKGLEVDPKQFDAHSLVVLRVTKTMDSEEWQNFIKASGDYLNQLFSQHNITLLICPDWVEFKEWK